MKKTVALLMMLTVIMCCMMAYSFASGEVLQPIIYRFNNEEMLNDGWYNAYSGFPTEYQIKDGVGYIEGFSKDDYSITPFSYSVGADRNFKLSDYPYVKAKYKWTTQHTGGHMQMYFWKPDGKNIVLYPTVKKNEWVTWSADLSTNEYKDELREKRSFELWFRSNAKGVTGTSQVEYIAFFPNTEDGKKAWENFDSKNPSVQCSSDEYLPWYSTAEKLSADIKKELESNTAQLKSSDMAKALVEDAIQKASDALELSSDCIKYTMDGVKAVTGAYQIEYTLYVGDKIECLSVKNESFIVKDNLSEPVILRFNSKEMIDMWQSRSYGKGVSVLSDGVMKTPFASDDSYGVSDVYYRSATEIPAEYRTDLSKYPYVKIKYRYEGKLSANGIQLYMSNTESTGNPHFKLGTPESGVWHTAVLDASMLSPDTAVYGGELTKLGVWFWHDTSVSGYSEIEYIAFFASREQCDLFDAENGEASTSAGTSDRFMPYYNEVSEISGNIKQAVDASISVYPSFERAKDFIESEFEKALAQDQNIDPSKAGIIIEPVSEKEPVATYKYTVYIGSVECRVFASETVSVNIKTSVVLHYNNPEFADKISVSGGSSKHMVTENGNSYFRAQFDGEKGEIYIAYNNIDNDHAIELSDYPVMAIRYRTSKGGLLQLYPVSSTSENTGASSKFLRNFQMEASESWTTMLLNEAKATTINGEWSGILKYLRIDFMRYSKAVKGDYIDIDYIGFFASEDYAEAYTKKVEGDTAAVNSAMLSVSDALNASYEDIHNREDAENKLESILSSVSENVRTYIELIGYEETDPTLKDNDIGSYAFRVYFINGPVTSAAVKYTDGKFKMMPDASFTAMGAQVRTSGVQGLRFGHKLEKSLWADVDVTDVSYGTVIVPEEYLEGDLTLETEMAQNVVAENIFDETDDYVIFTAVVTNIPESDYNVRFAARAYVKYTFDGKSYTVYSDDTKIRSVNDVIGLSEQGYVNYPVLTGNVTYDRETWMKPFWEGDTVYHELFWPIMPEGADENDDLVIDLLYPISDVIIVKNGFHTCDFSEGKDYYVNENGQLVIPYGSAINRMPFTEYVSDTPKTIVGAVNGVTYDYKKISTDLEEYKDYVGKYLYFTEGTNIQGTYQYSISYRHAAEWDENGLLPAYEENALPRVRSKLANKEPINIGYFGDSITAFGNQTGPMGFSPYTIHWKEAVAKTLEAMYGYTEDGNRIYIRSKAQGGLGSNWGANGGATNVISGDPSIPGGYAAHRFAADSTEPYNNGIPDLFVLAFGMNDEGLTPEQFKANTLSIIDQILTLNENCEFVLVSTSMPNPMWNSTKNRTQHEKVLEEIVTELRARENPVNIDVANVQGMHKYFLTKKPYRDMTGNNMNHQNDMLSRLYAQTIVTTIAGECR